MTSVQVDPNRCRAYGLCVGLHPEVFAIPPGSPVVVVQKRELDDDDIEDVEEAIRACPSQALSLVRE